MPKPPPKAALRRALTLCLRNLRHARGISQERLAWAAEIDRAYMSGLERGRHSPTLEMVYRLLAGLEVSFTQFAMEFERCLKRARRIDENG